MTKKSKPSKPKKVVWTAAMKEKLRKMKENADPKRKYFILVFIKNAGVGIFRFFLFFLLRCVFNCVTDFVSVWRRSFCFILKKTSKILLINKTMAFSRAINPIKKRKMIYNITRMFLTITIA